MASEVTFGELEGSCSGVKVNRLSDAASGTRRAEMRRAGAVHTMSSRPASASVRGAFLPPTPATPARPRRSRS